MVDVLRVLTSLRSPTGVPGSARVEQPDDTDLLVESHRAFAEDAGVAVSMAGRAPLVTRPAGTVARIRPVCTPAHLPGHGYGSAFTAAVAASLLPHCQTVMLFADSAKPENNRLYARLGFVESTRIVEVSLDP